MPTHRPDLRLLWPHVRQRALLLTAGGHWTAQLHSTVRRNLRWFWFDGIFAQAAESITVAFLSLFVLALGASAAQIGLMSALSNLSAALLVLPGAALVERWGRRKQICLIGGGGIARVALLALALLPLAGSGPAIVYIAIALAVIRVAFANLSVPAWTELAAAIVPLQWRGRYFASRNIAMGIAGMLVTYLAGQLITALGSPTGYQWAMGMAFIIGVISTLCFAQIQEPADTPAPQAADGLALSLLVGELRASPRFVTLCAITALWNFSLNLAGPFFGVYLVSTLGASASFVGALAVINGLAALPGQRLAGVLADRWGPRRVQLVSGLLIPFVPWLWALSRAPWQVIPAEIASGFLWAAYGLASFNFLLTLTPAEHRARYAALYQIVVTATLAIGAGVGGIIAMRWGYAATMVVSGLGRLGAALLFARLMGKD